MIAFDFFGANGREPAESLLLALEEHVHDAEVASHQAETKPAFVAIGKGAFGSRDGNCMATDDNELIARDVAMFEDLYQYFTKKRR